MKSGCCCACLVDNDNVKGNDGKPTTQLQPLPRGRQGNWCCATCQDTVLDHSFMWCDVCAAHGFWYCSWTCHYEAHRPLIPPTPCPVRDCKQVIFSAVVHRPLKALSPSVNNDNKQQSPAMRMTLDKQEGTGCYICKRGFCSSHTQKRRTRCNWCSRPTCRHHLTTLRGTRDHPRPSCVSAKSRSSCSILRVIQESSLCIECRETPGLLLPTLVNALGGILVPEELCVLVRTYVYH